MSTFNAAIETLQTYQRELCADAVARLLEPLRVESRRIVAGLMPSFEITPPRLFFLAEPEPEPQPECIEFGFVPSSRL